MLSAFERFLSGWPTITIASTSCATVNDLVNKHLRDVASCYIYTQTVYEFRRWFFTVWFKPLERNTSGDTYYDIRKLCNDVFCRKETLPMRFALVSTPVPLPAAPNSVSRGPGVSFRVFQHVRTAAKLAVYSVWENEYLQYSCTIFPHCSTVP